MKTKHKEEPQFLNRARTHLDDAWDHLERCKRELADAMVALDEEDIRASGTNVMVDIEDISHDDPGPEFLTTDATLTKHARLFDELFARMSSMERVLEGVQSDIQDLYIEDGHK